MLRSVDFAMSYEYTMTVFYTFDVDQTLKVLSI